MAERPAASRFGRRLRGLGPWAASITAPYPPGHYHSPVPSRREVQRRSTELFRVPKALPGIDLREDDQLELAQRFASLMEGFPFAGSPPSDFRYHPDNGWFAHGDGIALYCMLRYLKPKRYLEIGSGWSSALALDVNDKFLAGAMSMTFVEPYPARLESLLRSEDHARIDLMRRPLSDVPSSVFDILGAGDILFIDSSHVSRIGSDVNQLFLDVFPRLPPGVHIHIHDIFYPFEYPQRWLQRGRAWNEAYLLRAYLAGNPSIRITWFNDYLKQCHGPAVAAQLPGWAPETGSSIWLETTG